MTRRELEKIISEREGKKSQVSIGNIREILSIITDLECEAIFSGDPEKSALVLLDKIANEKAAIRSI